MAFQVADQAARSAGLAARAARHWSVFPWWMWCWAALWPLLLVAWLPTAYAFAPAAGGDLTRAGLVRLAWVAAVATGWTVAWGAFLGFRRAWPVLGLSVPAGTGVLLVSYVAAMLLSPPAASGGGGSPDGDNAAGAGLVFLALPTALVLAVLLGAGAGAGWLVAALTGRRAIRGTPGVRSADGWPGSRAGQE